MDTRSLGQMKLHVADVVRYQGRDFRVEGLLTYRIAQQALPLARLVDGDRTLWLEPTLSEMGDRVILLEEVHDLDMATPPPTNICYHGGSYLVVLSGTAQVDLAGSALGRHAGRCEVWRYRAAGDLYVQIERWPEGILMLAGASCHVGMLEVASAKQS